LSDFQRLSKRGYLTAGLGHNTHDKNKKKGAKKDFIKFSIKLTSSDRCAANSFGG